MPYKIKALNNLKTAPELSAVESSCLLVRKVEQTLHVVLNPWTSWSKNGPDNHRGSKGASATDIENLGMWNPDPEN